MRLTLSSTAEIVELGGGQRARVWQGETAGGVRCFALIVRVGTDEVGNTEEFDADLQGQAPPLALLARLIL